MLLVQHPNTKTAAVQTSMPCLQLLEDTFDVLVHSPLARASETAEIIWGDRQGKVNVLPSLREVDLYSFQVGHSTQTGASVTSLHDLSCLCMRSYNGVHV